MSPPSGGSMSLAGRHPLPVPAVGGWMAGRVLVIDRDPVLRVEVASALRDHGLVVVDMDDGAEGRAAAVGGAFDVVIVDLAAEGLCGLEGCRRIRCESDVPLLITSEHGSELDRVLGLESGADDYLVRPYSIPELISRVRAVLRRRQLDRRPSRPYVRVGDMELDMAALRVRVGGRELRLTPMEFGILALLASDPGRTFTPREILRQLWNSQHVGHDGACKTHIANLRHKLEDDASDPRRIVTVRRVGYVLCVCDEAPPLNLVR